VLHQGKLICDGSPEQVFSAGASLARETGIQLPFAVRCCLAVGSLPAPLPLTIEQLDDRLAHWQGPASSPVEQKTEEPTTARMEIRHLHHIYDEGIPEPVQALTDIDLDILPGQILAIAGASGSGKTTLVQHLNGLLQPSVGNLTLDGLDLWDSKLKPQQLRRLVGLVFQFPEAQLFAETVAEDVAFGPRNLGLDESTVAECVAAALHAVQLPHKEYGQRSPFHLSGGERRRVAIAGVLAMNPQILVLDEPTAGLDAQSTQLLIEIFRNLQRDQCSVVLVTHDMDLIAEVASRLVILANGGIVFDGSPAKAFESDFFTESSPLIPPAAWRFSQLRRQREGHAPDLLTDAEVAAYARSLVPPLAETN
jgi:energy-coupling factor transport system ATP-binding protein